MIQAARRLLEVAISRHITARGAEVLDGAFRATLTRELDGSLLRFEFKAWEFHEIMSIGAKREVLHG